MQLDAVGCEVVGDLVVTAHGTGQPIELGDHKDVAVTVCGRRPPQAGTVGIAGCESGIEVDTLGPDTTGRETVVPRGESLFVGGDSTVLDLRPGRAHGCVT